MPVILDNPIINSYVQGLQMRRQQEQADFEKKMKTEEGARAEKQLQGYLSHLKAEEEHQKGQLSLEQERVKQEANAHRLQATQALAGMQASGQYDPQGKVPDQLQVGGQLQTTQNPGTPGPTFDLANLPSQQTNVQPTLQSTPSPQPAPYEIAPGVMFNPAGIKNHQDIFAQKIAEMQQTAPIETKIASERAGAVAGAEANAKLPSETALLKQKTDAQREIDKANNDRAQLVAQIGAGARLGAARIGAQARIDAAKLGSQVDPTIVENNAQLHAVGLGGAPLGNSKADVVTKMALAKQGFVDLSGKDATKLKDVHGLDTLYDEMSNFVRQLPSSGVNAVGQQMVAKIPASDLKNFENRIRGISGNIAKTLGGESGRLSEDDIKRAMGLLVRPGLTKEQAIDDLRFFGATTRNKVMEQILGGMSDKQKLLVLQQYNFDPKQFDTGVQYQGHKVPKFDQDPKTGEWGVFNPKTGLVEPIGGSK